MSIIHTFDDTTKEILKPSHVTGRIDGFPDTVVVSFGQKMVDIILASAEHEVISKMYAGIDVPIYKVRYRQKEFALFLTWVGGPATVSLLEEVLAKGAKKIFLFGSCGILDREIAAGRIILPTWACRDEGTSYHYIPAAEGHYIEVKTAARMEEIFREIGVPYICGKTWTTDALYRETAGNMEKRRSEGCVAVDMECASVMAMAQFRGVEACQFLYAADNLDAADWDARILGNLPDDMREQIVRIALEVVSRL